MEGSHVTSLEKFLIAAPHFRPHIFLAQLHEPFSNLQACRPCYVLNGRSTIDDQLYKLFRVVHFIKLPPRSFTGLWVASFPMLFEVRLTTARPMTTPGWTVNRMRKVGFEVSVPFLHTVECILANWTLWCNGGRKLIGLSADLIRGQRWRDRS